MKKLLKKLIFRIFYKKIPKTNFGRCINCHASSLCGFHIKCTATMEQQYELFSIEKLIKKLNN